MSAAPPTTDELPIALRAFAGLQYVELKEPKSTASKRPKLGASPWILIFDTETATDAGQALRFGTYQLREGETLREEGIFYDPEGVTPDELVRLRSYAAANELRLLNRDDFADEIFFGIAWQLRASIIGFNLPFDISRIAIAHGPARREMRGGFSFTLSRQKIFPHVCVKHLSQRSAFVRFAAAAQLDSRGQRRRGLKTPVRRGHFIDVKTLAGALLARSFSLSRLSEFLNVEHPKLDFDEFDGPITDDMIRYAVRDVQTTWECYVALKARLDGLGLPDLVPEKVYSEASIGKASIRAMGILPWQKVQPNVPRQLLANVMSSYFGGLGSANSAQADTGHALRLPLNVPDCVHAYGALALCHRERNAMAGRDGGNPRVSRQSRFAAFAKTGNLARIDDIGPGFAQCRHIPGAC